MRLHAALYRACRRRAAARIRNGAKSTRTLAPAGRRTATLPERSQGHYDIAWARGTLAIGYAKAGRNADAIREFKLAIPPMVAATRENSEDDDSASVAARSQMLQTIVEAYIGALARDANRSAGLPSRHSRSPLRCVAGQCSRRWQVQVRV